MIWYIDTMLLALIHIVMKYDLNTSYRNTIEFISYQNMLISEHRVQSLDLAWMRAATRPHQLLQFAGCRKSEPSSLASMDTNNAITTREQRERLIYPLSIYVCIYIERERIDQQEYGMFESVVISWHGQQ